MSGFLKYIYSLLTGIRPDWYHKREPAKEFSMVFKNIFADINIFCKILCLSKNNALYL
jgi:hypothetical protein